MSEQDYTLKVCNRDIWHFFHSNPTLDFETCVLVLIDILNITQKNANATLQNAANARILSILNENTAQLSDLKKDISHITNDIFVKFVDIKKEYTENIRHIILNTNSLYSDKVTSHIDKTNNILIDKTNMLLTDIIPKSHVSYNQQITKSIQEHNQTLLDETARILSSKPSEDALRQFLSQFETKTTQLFQTIQQPLMTYISATEDRLIKSMSSIQEKTSAHDKILENLNEFLNKAKYRNSTHKGKNSENKLEDILNYLYPSSFIKNTSGTPNSGDFIMEEREGLKPRILFENKDYTANVNTDEVEKFIRDVHTQKCHGVFISQSTGIVGKRQYQIEIFGNSVLVYIHNCCYEPERVKIAVDIIDSISDSLDMYMRRQGDGSVHENILSDMTMEDINNEYSRFVQNKLAVIETVKFSTKELSRRIINQMDEIRFPTLATILGNKYGKYHGTSETKSTVAIDESKNDVPTISCPSCDYKAPSKRSLAAHRRGCLRKSS
jgi:hypothetical protein